MLVVRLEDSKVSPEKSSIVFETRAILETDVSSIGLSVLLQGLRFYNQVFTIILFLSGAEEDQSNEAPVTEGKVKKPWKLKKKKPASQVQRLAVKVTNKKVLSIVHSYSFSSFLQEVYDGSLKFFCALELTTAL